MALNDDIEQRLREAMEEMTRNAQDSAAGIRFEEEARRRATQTTAAFTAAGGTATTTVKDFGKAMASATEGMGKYGGAIKGMTGGASDLLSKFGPLGFVVGQLTKLMGAGVAAVLDQNDALIKNYRELSKLGGATTLTTDKILEMANKAGYASGNMGIITQSIAKVNSGMVTLGMNHTQGIEQFGKLIAVTQKTRDAYFRMGLSQEELTSAQADYVSTTAGLGQRQSLSADRQYKQSMAYVDSLIELTSLTGMQADEQKAAMDQAATSLAFQTYTHGQSVALAKAEEASRQAALNRDGKAEAAAEKQITAITDRMHREGEGLRMMTQVFGAGSEAVRMAMFRMSNGFTMFDENSGKLQVGLGKSMKKFQEYIEGKGGVNIGAVLDSVYEDQHKFANTFRVLSITNEDSAKQIGGSARALAQASVNYGKEQFESREANVKADMELRKLQGGYDSRMDLQTKLNKTEVDAKVALDEMVATISGPVNSTFDALVSSLGELGRMLGKLIPGAVGKSITARFSSQEERDAEGGKLREELAKNAAKKKETAAAKEGWGTDLLLFNKEKELAKLEAEEKVLRERLKVIEGDRKPKQTELSKKKELIQEMELEFLENEKIIKEKITLNEFKTQTERDNYAKKTNDEQHAFAVRINKLREEINQVEEREAKKKRDDVYKRNNMSPTVGGSAPGAAGHPMGGTAAAAGAAGAKSYLERMIQTESGGRNIANIEGTSKAFGLGQMTPGTFDTTVKNAPDTSSIKGMSWSSFAKDPELQRQVLQEHERQNRAKLASSGFATSDTNMYLTHHFGAGGGPRLLRAPDNDKAMHHMSEGAFNSNRQVVNPNTTVGELKRWAHRRIQDPEPLHQARDGGIFSGPDSGYPVELHGDEVVIPMKDLGNTDKQDLPAELKSSNTEKLTVANFTKILTDQAATEAAARAATPVGGVTTTTAQSNAEFVQVMGEMMNKMTAKYDMMIDQLTAINRVQGEILTYTR